MCLFSLTEPTHAAWVYPCTEQWGLSKAFRWWCGRWVMQSSVADPRLQTSEGKIFSETLKKRPNINFHPRHLHFFNFCLRQNIYVIPSLFIFYVRFDWYIRKSLLLLVWNWAGDHLQWINKAGFAHHWHVCLPTQLPCWLLISWLHFLACLPDCPPARLSACLQKNITNTWNIWLVNSHYAETSQLSAHTDFLVYGVPVPSDKY